MKKQTEKDKTIKDKPGKTRRLKTSPERRDDLIQGKTIDYWNSLKKSAVESENYEEAVKIRDILITHWNSLKKSAVESENYEEAIR